MNWFSPIIFVLSNISLPGPNATHNSFCAKIKDMTSVVAAHQFQYQGKTKSDIQENKHLLKGLNICLLCSKSRGYDSVIRRMQSWVCLLYNLYNTNEFILHMTPGHTKNELIGVVNIYFFFLIQFNVPFKIISLIETRQSIGGAKREYPGKTT